MNVEVFPNHHDRLAESSTEFRHYNNDQQLSDQPQSLETSFHGQPSPETILRTSSQLPPSSDSTVSKKSTSGGLQQESQLPPKEKKVLSKNSILHLPKQSEKDITEAISVMLFLQNKHQPNPAYIETIQTPSFRVIWRKKIAEWLLQFASEFSISHDTIAGSLNLVDRYLSLVPTKKTLLQLVAMVAIFVSAKLHEPFPIPLLELQRLAEGMYTAADIKLMELNLLHVVNWDLNPITPHAFTRHLLLADCWNFMKTVTTGGTEATEVGTLDRCISSTSLETTTNSSTRSNDCERQTVQQQQQLKEILSRAEGFMEYSMTEYCMIRYLPSEVAIGSILLSHRIMAYEERNHYHNHNATNCTDKGDRSEGKKSNSWSKTSSITTAPTGDRKNFGPLDLTKFLDVANRLQLIHSTSREEEVISFLVHALQIDIGQYNFSMTETGITKDCSENNNCVGLTTGKRERGMKTNTLKTDKESACSDDDSRCDSPSTVMATLECEDTMVAAV
eukprot:g2930.t1